MRKSDRVHICRSARRVRDFLATWLHAPTLMALHRRRPFGGRRAWWLDRRDDVPRGVCVLG
ncbi:MAG: hypothetical protein ACRD0G_16135 [Acidimicrobiales bacterium]